MSYTLFLDDIRDPPWQLGHDVLIARNNRQFMRAFIDFGVPEVISFDHDLGEDDASAMYSLHWIIDRHLDGDCDLSSVKQVFVHSANPAGALNLQSLWDSFASSMGFETRAVLRPA